jgi:sugar phosphate isomerase/epimerase
VGKQSHEIALASGVVVGSTPEDTVSAAAFGGFDSVGLWVEPPNWTAATTRAVRQRLADTGLRALDVEVIWIKPGPDDPNHFRLIDIGAEVGAANVLVVAADPDFGNVAARFQRLCEHAGADGPRVAMEFGLFTDLGTLDQTLGVLNRVDHPAKSILIDTLHLHRSGATPADIGRVPPGLIAYSQFCDAGASLPDLSNRAAVRAEAVDGRLNIGEGILPLAEVLGAMPPRLPLSIEVRSKALRDAYPDIYQRSKVVADATRAFLARAEGGA